VAMVLTGSSESGSREASILAANRPEALYSTAGIHPHNAKDRTDDSMANLATILSESQVVAVGECGLDFNRDFSPRPVQEAVFEEHIALAASLKMPLFLHQRDAHERFMEILKPWRDKVPGAVVHCFTGTRDELLDYMDLDLHVGITGWICDERRGADLRANVSLISIDRLMIETDAPYLIPRDLRPKPRSRRNEPRWLPHIARTVAQHRGDDVATMTQEVLATTREFFGLPRMGQRSVQ